MTLSQDQINAILEGTGTYEEAPDTDGNSLEGFFQHLSQQGMTAGSQAVSQALGKSVVLSHPVVSRLSAESLLKDTTSHQVMIQTGYQAGQDFPLLFLIKDYDVAVIFDILMGKDGRNPDLEIGDLQISAIGEVMNQLIGAAATAISGELGSKLAMKPPASESLNLEQQALPAPYGSSELLCVRYQLTIEGVLDSEIFELWPLSDATAFHRKFTTPAPSAEPSPAPAMASTLPVGTQSQVAPPPTMPPAQPYAAPSPQPAQYPPQAVQSVQFGPLGPSAVSSITAGSLDRILDIPLKVTVELGSSRLKVKNVLELAKGSVVELDKLSGEPVDLLVNGRLMARGEVVVINENFGVRISEILGPEARLQHFSDGG
jgi:flagellar motor switch protein FliN